MKVKLLLLFLLLCSLSQAAVYYIDPSGKDSNNGSSGSPWKTLAYACSKAKTSGDIIHINAGTYAETSVSYLATGVSIEGEGTSSIITSTLSAEFVYTLALNSSEGSNGNQHVSDIKMSGGMVAWAAIAVNGRSNVKIYNCTFENFVAQGIVFNGGTGYMSRAPGTFATGNEFHDNEVTNCARYVAANDNGEGCLMLGGQNGILIYNNTIIQTGRSTGANGYPLKYYSEGYCKGVKIYNNTLTTSPAAGQEPKMSWGFIYESHNSLGGIEFYGNTCKGALDLVLSSKGSYDFAWDIHDNTFGFDTQSPALDSEGDVGIRFEFNVERTNIYGNHFKNLAMAIYVGGNTGQTMKDLYIYNNLFENLGNNLNGRGCAVKFTSLPMSDVSNTVTNWNIWNNVMIGGASNSTGYGIQLPHGIASNFSVRNNIITGFDLGSVQKSAYGTGSNVSIENNIFYNNGNNNDPVGSVTYSNYTYQNNLKVNPLFVSSADFHLQSSSPAIGKGIDVGLQTDHDGNAWNDPPSIGAYESGSAPSTPEVPVYQSSVIENATPNIIEISYDLSLANIVPAASAFNVRVNSVARTVSSVAISGGEVRLNLASAVVSGDVVTISYTKPATNPLQTAAGGQAASLSTKTVTNSCAAQIPVYVSSSIQNSTPNTLEMTYNLSLTSIVPAVAAFSVMVNSVLRTVNSVSVSGTKVLLTLSYPVINGDVVTVSYTKPASNPLQTAAGGQAATLSAQTVVNNVSAAIPAYVSSAIQNATPNTLEMIFNLSLASIVPAASAFSVSVNSVARTVNTVSVSGTKVLLTLLSPVINGDVVTVAYTKPSTNPLQTASGGQAATLSAQTVVNNVSAAIPVYVSAAIQNATPGTLEMTYSLSLTSIVPSSAAFSVRVNSVARTVSTVSVSATKVLLTLSSPVVNGDVVTVAYTKPSTNPLQTASGGQAATLSAQTVVNNVSAAIPVYVSAAIQNATPGTLEMTYSLSLTSIVPSSAAFSVRVNSVARTVNTVSVSGTKVLLTLLSPVIYGDVVTVSYTKPSTNPLQTASGGQAATLSAQTVVNNVSPAIPAYVSAAIQNATPGTLEMTYSLSLTSIVPSSAAFSVRVNSVARTVSTVSVSATKVMLTLSSPVVNGDVVTVSYTKPASNPLQTAAGGQAATLSAQTVVNNVSPAIPAYVSSAIQNATPNTLEMTYNLSLASIVPAASAFSVMVNSVARTVNTVSVSGTKVLLILSSPVVNGNVVTVSYTKPASNPLQTTAGGQAATLSAQTVANNVNAAIPVYVSSAIQNASPNILEMTYNLSLASIVPASAAFSVRVNSVARTVNTISVSGTKVLLTLSSPVINGDVITVSYTKPTTNPLQTASGGQAATLSTQTVVNNVSIAIPVYVSSAIQNATPNILEMTYNLSLAGILPSSASFSVRVNSVARTVNTVAVSGTKVQLTLSSPVIYGDIVTVAYTKPASSPLQTAAGGQAATLSAQTVVNNVSIAIPAYVSSAIQNATPNTLEMTYNLSLANIVPSTSSFSVRVNSVTRTVNSVSVSGTKVLLILSSPVVNGDVITVSYAKPASNPLQTAAGGQAVSLGTQTVVNNVITVIPVYVSSAVQDANPNTLEITYNSTLANIVPSSAAFSVRVNSAARSVNTISVSGTKVLLILSSPVLYGDVVTVSYTKPASNPLQTISGGQAATLSTKTVTNNCTAQIPVYLSSVVENDSPEIIEISYDLSLANIVPAASAFTVLVNSVARTISSVAIVGGKVQVTLSTAIIFGDILTIAYTKPASNPLQTDEGGTANTINGQSVANNCVAPTPVYVSSVIENSTPSILEITYNLSLANIVPASSAFYVLVNSAARTITSAEITGGKVRLTLAGSVVYGDIITVAYTKPVNNPLQTEAGGVAANIIAQSVTNNCSVPIPKYISSVVENATPSVLEMTYDLSLANIVPSASAFSVRVNYVTRSVSSVAIVDGKVRLTLASPVDPGNVIAVSYTRPASNPLQTVLGGAAVTIRSKSVTNNCVSPIPVYVSSVVENDTPGIIKMTYDLSLANIVPAVSVFNVQVNSVTRPISSVAIIGGEVQLTLSASIVYGDIVTVDYTVPSSNPLQSASGNKAASIQSQSVTNNCGVILPNYVSSLIQNATPAILEMSYSLSLTNIVPATTAFYVLVNSVARTVDSVIIAGGNVQLILEEPVVFGDLITLTYTKPVVNPLQTNSGGVAANIVNQKVTNYCSAPIPTYLSSVVENSTPSFIDLTYDFSLTNIVPAASAFKIQVNSVDRTATSVAITGGKVRLTLASPVFFGDMVTISYTKPSINPLQTVSGGVAASMSAKSVTNNLNAPIPVYVSSIVENAAPAIIKMSYNLSLANIVPAASAFRVLVNSVARTINSIAIVGGKVQLTLSTDVVFGDVLTVEYIKPASNPLQTASGGVATAVSAQSVTNNCVAPTPVYVGSVIEDANPAILVMTYNLGLVNIVPATTAFYVLVNSVAYTVDSVNIVGENLQLTLEKPVVTGDVVTVTYTKPASNPIQTSQGGTASSITRKPVINNCVAPAPAYLSSVVENSDPSVLEMTYDLSLANIVPPTTAFNVLVNSVACKVDSVIIGGEYLQLILEKPVFFGDTVTITYSKPANNPIQTTLGGTALNITSEPVINNCINDAPVVVITSPDYNSTFLSPANITVNVSASDPDGTISVLEFYNGTTLIGSSCEAPYSFTWSNVEAGSYSITVNAIDNFNTITTSSPISVYVINYEDFTNEPPIVQISNPRKGNVYDPTSSISIDAIASDPDGIITRVEFYNDTIRLVELTSAPYSYLWKDVAAGTYTLTAVATDDQNAKTVSAPVKFVVGEKAKEVYSEIVNVYPNPNNGQFLITFSNPALNGDREIIIMDLLGKLVYSKIVPKDELLLHFDLSDIKSGMYVMMIKNKEILITKKIIIE